MAAATPAAPAAALARLVVAILVPIVGGVGGRSVITFVRRIRAVLGVRLGVVAVGILAVARRLAAPAAAALRLLAGLVVRCLGALFAFRIPALGFRSTGFGFRVQRGVLVLVESTFHAQRVRVAADLRRPVIGALDLVVRRDHALVRHQIDRYPAALLDIQQRGALLVENEHGDLHRHHHVQRLGAALQRFGFHRAQHLQGGGFRRADHARALAVRTYFRRAFQHARAHALARHFQQAEGGDAAHLDARAVLLQAVLQLPFHRAVVARLIHVDEIDDDETGHVAQAQLPGNFFGGFHVGGKRRRLDIVFLGGLAGVDVDRHQRFRRVDDNIAAGFERHRRLQQRVQLALHAIALQQRLALFVALHVLRMARHEHAHEVLGVLVGLVAVNDDLVDILRVLIADRPLDQVAFLIDEAGGRGLERQVADVLPQPQQVIEVALDLDLGAVGACGADDQAHAF